MEKRIILKSLDLVNFKGIRELHVDFDEKMTTVSGKNGTGKTTIFDAFTWALFGKDSRDGKVFSVKTIGPDGQPIPDIPHEVRCTLLVGGETVEIMRSYCEDWTKRRGSSERVFTGHTESRYYNGVPCSVREFSDKVAALCDESVFKFITNPLHFTAQRPDVQREMLFRMAGDVTDEEIALGREDFTALLGRLSGKTMEEYRREIASRKRRVKEEMDGIPARIDERRRQAPQPEDWEELERLVAAKREEHEALGAELYDANEAMKLQAGRRDALYAELNEVNRRISERASEVHRGLYADYNKAVAERGAELRAVAEKEREIAASEDRLGDLVSRRERYVRLREELLEEWKAVKAETLTFDESQFTCPTCGRKYDFDEVQSRQTEMTARFNRDKAAKLEENKQKGLAVRQALENVGADIAKLETETAALREELAGLRKTGPSVGIPPRPDVDAALAADRDYAELTNRATDIRNRIAAVAEPSGDSGAVKARMSALESEISMLCGRLSKRDAIAANERRIAELEKLMREQSQALADLECAEATVADLAREKASRTESRVNGMFGTVRFRMFRKLVNGGEEPACEATVDGVPFGDLNNAGKINAGLDIINAICRSEGIYAPIFVDNAESVNELTAVESQIVRLVVTEDETLKIE